MLTYLLHRIKMPWAGSRSISDGRNGNSFTKFRCTILRVKKGYEIITRKSAALSLGGKVGKREREEEKCILIFDHLCNSPRRVPSSRYLKKGEKQPI